MENEEKLTPQEGELTEEQMKKGDRFTELVDAGVPFDEANEIVEKEFATGEEVEIKNDLEEIVEEDNRPEEEVLGKVAQENE